MTCASSGMSRPRDARSDAISTESFRFRKAANVLRPDAPAVDLVRVPICHAGRRNARSRAKRTACSLLSVKIRVPWFKGLSSAAAWLKRSFGCDGDPESCELSSLSVELLLSLAPGLFERMGECRWFLPTSGPELDSSSSIRYNGLYWVLCSDTGTPYSFRVAGTSTLPPSSPMAASSWCAIIWFRPSRTTSLGLLRLSVINLPISLVIVALNIILRTSLRRNIWEIFGCGSCE